MSIRGELGENEDFFEKFSSIRISYAASEKKHIQEFQFPSDEIDGELADQLWPTLGGWNVSGIYNYFCTCLNTSKVCFDGNIWLQLVCPEDDNHIFYYI